jgi:hypothetical protein
MSLSYKDILTSLLPDGELWRPAEGEGFDKFLEGMGQNEDRIREYLASLAELRNPDKTSLLGDLEKEFGIKTNDNISEADRRAQLAGAMYARRTNGSRDFLQTQLQRAGFDVYVYDNAPAVDPDLLIAGQAQMYCGEALAQCGEPLAQCADFEGELIVNGDIFTTNPNYLVLCGEALAQCGEATALAGNFSGVTLDPVEYEVPDGAGTEVERWWNFIFFVGGEVTRGGSGEIVSLGFVDIPIQSRKTFKRLILKYKPMHSWCAAAVNWV